jgi:hypothetical protein
VWYGVPASLKLALHYGYISPNLPPPLGMAWVARRDALSAFTATFSRSRNTERAFRQPRILSLRYEPALWFGFCVGLRVAGPIRWRVPLG